MRCPSLDQLPPPPPGLAGWPWTEESARIDGHPPGQESWPAISVVIPSFNQARYIEAALRSVLLQGYPDVEIVIYDGGSSDGSVDTIRRYSPWIAFWASEPDRGQSHALNKAIARATGPILFWLNADDIALKDAFGLAAAAFASPSRPRMVQGGSLIVDENGRELERFAHPFTSWEDAARNRRPLAQVSMFFHRALFDELGGLDESLVYSMDKDLLLRFARRFAPLAIGQPLAAYRAQAEAKTIKSRVKSMQEGFAVWRRHVEGQPWFAEFLDQRAANWLDFAGAPGLRVRERLTCLVEAARLLPRLLLRPRFWRRALAALAAVLRRPPPRERPGRP